MARTASTLRRASSRVRAETSGLSPARWSCELLRRDGLLLQSANVGLALARWRRLRLRPGRHWLFAQIGRLRGLMEATLQEDRELAELARRDGDVVPHRVDDVLLVQVEAHGLLFPV